MTSTLDIQRRLAALGYSPGALDGIPGPKTTAAIKQFQRARNLVADGIVGPLTMAALFGPPATVAPAALTTMKTSAAGRAAIAQREGNRLTAYPDPATGGEPWTIGVGHTSAAGQPKVVKGMKITAAESDTILARDLAGVEKAVLAAVKVKLSQNEFDALVSLAFNIGNGAFAKSTLVKKLNAGDRAGAADQFLVWNKAAGKVMKGLVTRRQAERLQFMS